MSSFSLNGLTIVNGRCSYAESCHSTLLVCKREVKSREAQSEAEQRYASIRESHLSLLRLSDSESSWLKQQATLGHGTNRKYRHGSGATGATPLILLRDQK